MKIKSLLIFTLASISTAFVLMAFTNSTTEVHTFHAYQCIVASASTESMTVVISNNSKPYKELKYYNRKTAYDVTPALNIVVENEKHGWELYSSHTSFDTKSNRMVYTFLMRKRV